MGNKQGGPAEAQRPQPASYYTMVRDLYKQVIQAIVRPPRMNFYSDDSLGPRTFHFRHPNGVSAKYVRVDFEIPGSRGSLMCSHWTRADSDTVTRNVLIYGHGNASCRTEVLPHLTYLLNLGLSVLSFDFGGSGKSDGEYVSLGWWESQDLAAVVAHLRTLPTTGKIALWGRSMGAASALMHNYSDPAVACCIADSSFQDLSLLCREVVERVKELAGWTALLFWGGFKVVTRGVKVKAKVRDEMR